MSPSKTWVSVALVSALAIVSVRAQGGIASGEARPAVYDEQNRPITAGGFVAGAPVYFEDITGRTGLGRFRHRSGFPEKRYILDTMTGGVAVLDYNRDGWLDIYLVNGSTYAALAGKEEHQISGLFRNKGDGTFEDVTLQAGVPNAQWGFGVVAGDYNRDGWPDLYVSNYGPNRLYRNNRDGSFTDVAAQAGVALPNAWTTGGSFGDYDGDGLLDLFVCGYAKFDVNAPPRSGIDVPINYCQYRGADVMCGPRGLQGERDFLFHNRGDGTFDEVAEAAGVMDKAGFFGFSAAWLDVDGDRRQDLVVINDSTPNFLYLNKGDGTFNDASHISGFALSRDGREQAGMGLAIGDYNLDGEVDFFITHFSDDYCTLYENQRDAFFLDLSNEAGIEEATLPFVSWGTAFLDYDNDGRSDLFLVNGHVYPAVDQHKWGTTWAERPLLFKNVDGRRFSLVPAAKDSGLAVVIVGRGAAFGDFDNDGREDIVINCMDSAPRVLRNVTQTANNWLTVKLTSRKSPTDGIGATVFLTAGGHRQRRDVFTGGSFMSSSDPRLYFGLGTAQSADRIEVNWPSGARQTVKDARANRMIEITEPEPATANQSRLPGISRPSADLGAEKGTVRSGENAPALRSSRLPGPGSSPL